MGEGVFGEFCELCAFGFPFQFELFSSGGVEPFDSQLVESGFEGDLSGFCFSAVETVVVDKF